MIEDTSAKAFHCYFSVLRITNVSPILNKNYGFNNPSVEKGPITSCFTASGGFARYSYASFAKPHDRYLPLASAYI
jgi:hypothetical protein